MTLSHSRGDVTTDETPRRHNRSSGLESKDVRLAAGKGSGIVGSSNSSSSSSSSSDSPPDDDESAITEDTEGLVPSTPSAAVSPRQPPKRSSWRQSYHHVKAETGLLSSSRGGSFHNNNSSSSSSFHKSSFHISSFHQSSFHSANSQSYDSPRPFFGGTSSIGNSASFHGSNSGFMDSTDSGPASSPRTRRSKSKHGSPLKPGRQPSESGHTSMSSTSASSRLSVEEISALQQMLAGTDDDDDDDDDGNESFATGSDGSALVEGGSAATDDDVSTLTPITIQPGLVNTNHDHFEQPRRHESDRVQSAKKASSSRTADSVAGVAVAAAGTRLLLDVDKHSVDDDGEFAAARHENRISDSDGSSGSSSDSDDSSSKSSSRSSSSTDDVDDETTEYDDDDYVSVETETDGTSSEGRNRSHSEASTAEEAAQVLLLQRMAENARGDPSNYHSSEDDDELLLDFEAGRHPDYDSKDEDDPRVGGDPDGIVFEGGESTIWEENVYAETANDSSDMMQLHQHDSSSGTLNSSAGSFREQKQKRELRRKLRESTGSNREIKGTSVSALEGDDESTQNNYKNSSSHETSRSDLRDDLEAQVSARLAAEDEEVAREVRRSIQRTPSQFGSGSALTVVMEENGSSALEMGTDDCKDGKDKTSSTTLGDAEVAPNDKEVDELDGKQNFYQAVVKCLFSKLYLVFLVVFVFLMVVANVVLIVYFVS
jgi:hypothetical protein